MKKFIFSVCISYIHNARANLYILGFINLITAKENTATFVF